MEVSSEKAPPPSLCALLMYGTKWIRAGEGRCVFVDPVVKRAESLDRTHALALTTAKWTGLAFSPSPIDLSAHLAEDPTCLSALGLAWAVIQCVLLVSSTVGRAGFLQIVTMRAYHKVGLG